MLITSLRKLYKRDLNKLKEEIALYKNEANLWVTDKAITNSAGNLCLHLVGNLNAFIGAVLGNSGYVRNREAEFSLKNIPQQQLVKQVEETIAAVDSALEKLEPSKLEEMYPKKVFEEDMTTGYFLLHLAMHLDYHLGQINYHRRLLDL